MLNFKGKDKIIQTGLQLCVKLINDIKKQVNYSLWYLKPTHPPTYPNTLQRI
jgi:hypothetical protein